MEGGRKVVRECGREERRKGEGGRLWREEEGRDGGRRMVRGDGDLERGRKGGGWLEMEGGMEGGGGWRLGEREERRVGRKGRRDTFLCKLRIICTLIMI